MHNDATGDTYEFTKQLALACENLGVKFHYNTVIQNINHSKDKIQRVETNHSALSSDIFITTLGAYTGEALRRIGDNNDIFPNKGYSIIIPKPSHINYNFSFADPIRKIYYCVLGNKIRIAGLSESVGFNSSIDENQVNFLKHQAKELIPNLDFEDRKNFIWTNFRSSTKSSTPLIKASTKFRNLFINSGHGGFGWTLAPISAQRLTKIISKSNQS